MLAVQRGLPPGAGGEGERSWHRSRPSAGATRRRLRATSCRSRSSGLHRSGPLRDLPEGTPGPHLATLTVTEECVTTAATVTAVSRPAVISRDPPFATAIVLLPHRRSSGSGVYDEAMVDFAWAVEDEGVETSWSEPQESWVWEGRRFADQLVVELLIGVASNFAWATVVRVFQRLRGRQVSATVGSRTTSEASERWIHVEGEGEAVADILKSM